MRVLIVTVLLFLACWLASLLLGAALLARRPRARDWRDTVVVGSVMGGVAIVAITETLSAFSRFQRGWIIAAWIALLAAAAVQLLRFHARVDAAVRARMRALLTFSPAQLSAAEMVMLGVIALQVLLLALVAVAYPPNNYDSMTYHLPRIMHWEQQRSVAFYPTNVMMQTRGAPFAEFAIAQSLLVAGSDRFANLVQWYAMVVSAVAASLVAAELGADRVRQIAASLLVVSIPMGVLQATSTQNDYVLAAWMIGFVLFAIRFLRGEDRWLWTMTMSAALGLAIATKQTAFGYAAPICLVVAVAALIRFPRRALAAGAVTAAVVLALNAPVIWRNLVTFRVPLGPSSGLTNDPPSARAGLSNALRNFSLHLPMHPRAAGLRQLSESALARLERVNARTGIDPADPRFSLTAGQNAFALPFLMHEDIAGNLLHVLLAIGAVLSCAAAVGRRRAQRSPVRLELVLLAACLVAGYAFFCYYFKWQLWNSRLQLALFVMAAPVVVTVLFWQWRPLFVATVVLVGVASFGWTIGNQTRPLRLSMPWRGEQRQASYFANRQDLWPVFQQLTAALVHSRCREIGLRIATDPFEYPLWVLLRDAAAQPTIRHLEGHAPVPFDPDFKPCAVLSAGREDPQAGGTPLRFGGFYLHLRNAH